MHNPDSTDPDGGKKQGKGVPPSNLNPKLTRHTTRQRPSPKVEDYISGIRKGNRIVLSKAITLVESTRPEHQQKALEIVEGCLPYSGRSVRIGITGSPGVGKSTFIEAFGQNLIARKRQIAVLAVDPTSQISKGSILGDKTRMPVLSAHEKAFIRPSPAGTSAGGVARKTREAIILCEAAGYDTVIVETVGVGQSETAVHSMVDFFLLLLIPGAGDELQGIKRGIVEMADLIAVNKADSERLTLAKQARREYSNALHLFPPKESGWTPQAVICSAVENTGIEEIWQLVVEFRQHTTGSGYFDHHRREQAKYWLSETIDARLRELFVRHPRVRGQLPVLENAVMEGRLSSFKAAKVLLDLFLDPKS